MPHLCKILFGAALTVAASAGAGHVQQAYPLTCRGGGELIIANAGADGVRIRFARARGAAPTGLSPGQCTWSDRALSPNEPTMMCDSSRRASAYVGALVRADQFTILKVYNDGQGCMRVTHVGP